MASTFEKDKIEKIHDDVNSAKGSRDSEVSSEYRK